MGNPQNKSLGTETRLHLEPHQVVLRPLVTEKGVYNSTEFNQYAFVVHEKANKVEIRKAVETLFDVRVEKVRTNIRRGHVARMGMRRGKRINRKHAYVTLREGDSIDLFK